MTTYAPPPADAWPPPQPTQPPPQPTLPPPPIAQPGRASQPARPVRTAARKPPAGPAERLHRWLAGPKPGTRPPEPPASDLPELTRVSLGILAAVLLGMVAQVLVVGALKHNRDQEVAYDDLRLTLAEGTTPVAPLEPSEEAKVTQRQAIPKGTPIAQLSIPAIGVKEIVLSGTTSGVLRSGIGHRRDTVLPAQVGTSIVMGRRMSYGGPFSQLADLSSGDTIDILTGQGPAQFKVLGVRHAGDPLPATLANGASRLTLVTAAGNRFAPNDVVRVDADLVGTPFAAATPYYTPQSLPTDERIMAQEPRALGYVVGWGILLVAAALASVWLRIRWGRWQAWLVSVPTLAYLGVMVADNSARILPNLM